MRNIRAYLGAHPWLFAGICALVATVIWLLLFRVLVEPNGNVAMGPSTLTWLALGFGAGVLVPDKPWRWAAAMVLPQPIIGLGHAIIGGKFIEEIAMVLVTLPVAFLMAVPIAAAAYFGIWVVSWASTSDKAARTLGLGATTFVVCAALSAIALIAAPLSWKATTLVLAAFVCGGYFGSKPQSSAWRTAMLCVGAGQVGFMALVIFDSVTGGSNHHMLPFELIYIFVITLPAALVSAWLGAIWQRYRTKARAA